MLFSLSALDETLVDAAYLISPVADMEKLIRSMMAGADVTEQELAEKQEIPTPFGETLSWRYLCYVREHPVSWRVPTRILYGARDNLVRYGNYIGFCKKISRRVDRHAGWRALVPHGGTAAIFECLDFEWADTDKKGGK